MAPWLNDEGFDNKKTKDVEEEMLRYEYGKKKSPSARFSHLHLPGLGAGMMAASKHFSMGDFYPFGPLFPNFKCGKS